MKNATKKGPRGGKLFNARTMRYGSYALVVTIIAMALLVGVNAILGLDAVRTPLRLDITKNKLFSIGEQTTGVLSGLQKDVAFIVLMPEEDFGSVMLKEIFKQYEVKSNGRVTLRFVDTVKDPQFVKRELDPETITGIGIGDLVVKSGSKVRLIDSAELQDTQYDYQTGQTYSNGLLIEQTFTSAILNVTSDVTPVVYFLTGHGEEDVTGQLSTLKGTLDFNNYEARSLTLTEAVPEDAAVIIMANPKTDLLGAETALLNDWLRNKGGDLIVFADANSEAPDLTNLNSVLEYYNLKLNSDLILEGNPQNYLDQQNIVIPRVSANEITTELDPNSVMLFLPNSRTVEILSNTKEWLESFPIFQTSAEAVRLDAASGFQTPIPGSFLMGAATISKGGMDLSKVVVIGNATFVTNDGMTGTTDNGKRYLLTMVNWMQDKTNEIIIPAKDNSVPTLSMTEQSKFFVFVFMAALLPLLIIGAGIFVWMRRKHL
jgi:hypothetical protein